MENILEDPVSWVNTFLPQGCFSTFLLPCWAGKVSPGWSTLYKGAISVVVSTAFVLAVNQYYQRRKRGVWSQGLPSSPVGPQQSSTIHPVERRRRLKVAYGPYTNATITRQKSITSEVATVNFADSDSEEEGVAVERRPLEINIVAIVDERGTEADDESSETEADVVPNAADAVEHEKEMSLFTGNDIQTKPVLLSPVNSETEVSEFNLTFELDSNDLERELTSSHDDSMNSRIVMDLEHNGGEVVRGYVEEDGGAKGERRDGNEAGKRVSFDYLRTSVCGGEGDDVVVTQAVVTIG